MAIQSLIRWGNLGSNTGQANYAGAFDHLQRAIANTPDAILNPLKKIYDNEVDRNTQALLAKLNTARNQEELQQRLAEVQADASNLADSQLVNLAKLNEAYKQAPIDLYKRLLSQDESLSYENKDAFLANEAAKLRGEAAYNKFMNSEDALRVSKSDINPKDAFSISNTRNTLGLQRTRLNLEAAEKLNLLQNDLVKLYDKFAIASKNDPAIARQTLDEILDKQNQIKQYGLAGFDSMILPQVKQGIKTFNSGYEDIYSNAIPAVLAEANPSLVGKTIDGITYNIQKPDLIEQRQQELLNQDLQTKQQQNINNQSQQVDLNDIDGVINQNSRDKQLSAAGLDQVLKGRKDSFIFKPSGNLEQDKPAIATRIKQLTKRISDAGYHPDIRYSTSAVPPAITEAQRELNLLNTLVNSDQQQYQDYIDRNKQANENIYKVRKGQYIGDLGASATNNSPEAEGTKQVNRLLLANSKKLEGNRYKDYQHVSFNDLPVSPQLRTAARAKLLSSGYDEKTLKNMAIMMKANDMSTKDIESFFYGLVSNQLDNNIVEARNIKEGETSNRLYTPDTLNNVERVTNKYFQDEVNRNSIIEKANNDTTNFIGLGTSAVNAIQNPFLREGLFETSLQRNTNSKGKTQFKYGASNAILNKYLNSPEGKRIIEQSARMYVNPNIPHTGDQFVSYILNLPAKKRQEAISKFLQQIKGAPNDRVVQLLTGLPDQNSAIELLNALKSRV